MHNPIAKKYRQPAQNYIIPFSFKLSVSSGILLMGTPLPVAWLWLCMIQLQVLRKPLNTAIFPKSVLQNSFPLFTLICLHSPFHFHCLHFQFYFFTFIAFTLTFSLSLSSLSLFKYYCFSLCHFNCPRFHFSTFTFTLSLSSL